MQNSQQDNPKRPKNPLLFVLAPLLCGLVLFGQLPPPTTVHTAETQAVSIKCRGGRHRVQVGETLNSIAQRHNTTPYRIALCNGLRSNRVVVGQVLLLPSPRLPNATAAVQ